MEGKMNTGSKRGNASFGFGSFMTVALVCFSMAGCDPSEKQVKEDAEQKANLKNKLIFNGTQFSKGRYKALGKDDHLILD